VLAADPAVYVCDATPSASDVEARLYTPEVRTAAATVYAVVPVIEPVVVFANESTVNGCVVNPFASRRVTE